MWSLKIFNIIAKPQFRKKHWVFRHVSVRFLKTSKFNLPTIILLVLIKIQARMDTAELLEPTIDNFADLITQRYIVQTLEPNHFCTQS